MQICISHETALGYLLRMPNLRDEGERPSRAYSVPAAVPDDARARRLLEALSPNLPEGNSTIDVLVSQPAGRYQTKTVHAHLCTLELPPGSFVPEVAWGIEFYLCSPELVFLQLAATLCLEHLIFVGFALCSGFRLDGWAPGGCAHREGRDRPLTSIRKLRGYLDSLPAGTPGRARAQRALEHVREGARSPREAAIAMLVGLPASLGGHQLGTTVLNQAVRVYDGLDRFGAPRWVERIPDIMVTARDREGRRRRVGIDYDPDVTHSDPMRVELDVDRRNLIASTDRFCHITLRSSDVEVYAAFCRAADRVRRCLGQRKRPRLSGSPDSADNLRRLADAEARRRELWDRVVGEGSMRL